MHNDTRDWQAYWFLNSVLVFSSAKSINRALPHRDAGQCKGTRTEENRGPSNLRTSYLYFVPIKPIASHIRLISHVQELRSRIFDLIASYTSKYWILAKRACVLPRVLQVALYISRTNNTNIWSTIAML